MMRAAALTIAILAAGPAWGHDDHDWMRSDGYRSGTTKEHCCSPNRDCLPIADSDLEMTPAGWRYKPTGEVVPEQDTFRSRDPQGRHWRCQGAIYWRDGVSEPPRTRCLFIGGTS